MVNYLEGAKLCKTNSERLEASARIILKDNDGSDSLGLFLYYIAYEEMAKAIFCVFVQREWVSEEFISSVFRDHRTKIFLFDEIFRSFSVIDGHGCLGGKKLGEKSLTEFTTTYGSKIREHRRITNNFLYVNNFDGWHLPSLSISEIKDEEKKIKGKVVALQSIFHFLIEKYDQGYTETNNFHFYEDKEGNFTIRFDQI